MSGERIKRLSHVAALLIFALALGVAFQAGVGLTARILPRIDVIEVHAINHAETADMATTEPLPALPGRYQY
ncbi:hypothetical protein [Salinicola avicenniae]|uniref:hypothetical protein n=1 Tax=Salinicola avicenniae TaxID=2916836 RepID=UPI0020749DD1|nr:MULTISPECIES: hypothetical protein [unclassified Salinicola]